MPRNRITKTISERALLTDVMPYETPIRFSNWGSYNFLRKKSELEIDPLLKLVFTKRKFSIPFSFKIKKDLVGTRSLQLVHPNCSESIADLYAKFDTMIARTCSKSRFSLRAPHSVSTYFLTKGDRQEYSQYLEKMSESDVYGASYFSYKTFTHLHNFFDSPEFANLEKKYSKMAHFDIMKFFPSIYTHTISWAVRGKGETKRLLSTRRNDISFTASFDRLMQYMNYNEKNGIPIGPELSRIFSEVIMQRIDCSVEKGMSKEPHPYQHDVDYRCCRYIDDFYLFFDDDRVHEKFTEILKDELEQYRFYINQEKLKISSRPFITEVSKRKIEVSSCINALYRSIKNKRWKAEKNAIEKLRVIASNIGDDYYALTNVFLSAILRKCKSVAHAIDDKNVLTSGLLVFLGVAFHWFRLDMRVNGSYKIGKLVGLLMDISKGLAAPDRIQIYNKIYTEISEAIIQASQQGRIIEALNLAIVAKDLGPEYRLHLSVLEKLSRASHKLYVEDETDRERMSYFSIVALLYCSSSDKDLKPIFDTALNESKKLLKKLNPTSHAEAAYLFVDLLKCPHLAANEKIELAKSVLQQNGTAMSNSKILQSLKVIESQSWYFDWDPKNLTQRLLKKKNFIPTY